MKIIAGLGNPGLRYANTRHNCGFLVLDALSDMLGIDINRQEHGALTGQARHKGEKLLLLKPQSYMNLSGFPLMRAANYYQVEPADMLIIFDDLSLACGRLRFRRGGSAGGQKGMQSIIEQAGTDKIARLKLGIGAPRFSDAASYVLSPFNREEAPAMAEVFKKAAEAALFWAEEGITAAMNQYNKKEQQEKEEESPS